MTQTMPALTREQHFALLLGKLPLLFNHDQDDEPTVARNAVLGQISRLTYSDGSWTGDELVALFSEFSRLYAEKQQWVAPDVRGFVTSVLIDSLDSQRVGLSLLGTGWRFLTSIAGQVGSRTHQTMLHGATLLNPVTPVEVQAYAKTTVPDLCDRTEADVAKAARVAYSSLADLPDSLLLDVVSSQTPPEAWFADEFPLHHQVEWLAPGIRP